MRGNSFSDTETRIQPAPSSVPSLTGQYFVSRGAGQFCQYLQYSGTWDKTAQYWPNYAAAERALADTGFDVTTAEGYIASNVGAQAIQARAAKLNHRQRTRRF